MSQRVVIFALTCSGCIVLSYEFLDFATFKSDSIRYMASEEYASCRNAQHKKSDIKNCGVYGTD